MRGFTLIEIMVATALAGLVILGAVAGFQQFGTISSGISTRSESTVDTVRLVSKILRTGRIANQCTAVTATPASIQCTVDMNTPPTITGTDDTTLRFIHSPGTEEVFFQKLVGAVWTNQAVYTGISAFEVCNDATCAMNDAITTRHRENLLAANPTPPNRFYRFRVTTTDAGGGSLAFPGSFYVRNPSRVTNLAYQYSMTE